MATAVAIRMARANGDPFPENTESVLQSTWGHLSPKARETYTGFILFTHGCHGDITAIDWEFRLPDGTELDSSPWFYTDLHDMIGELICDRKKPLMCGGVWQWEGTFRRNKNGTSKWSGKTRPMRLTYRFPGRR